MSKTKEINLLPETEENPQNNIEDDLLILIKACILTKDVKKARDLIDEYPDADIAKVLNDMLVEEQLTFLRLLKTSEAATIFSYLEDEIQTKLAQCFTEDWGMKLLQELQSDELADVLEELPANVTSKILAFTPNEKRIEINKLLKYSENQVGSIMSIDISSIKNTYTCEQALNKIRRDYNKSHAELVHYYYVIDGSNKLLGSLTLEDIAFAEPNTLIDDIYYSTTSLATYHSREYAAQIFSEHDLSVLPVVNREGYLVGMVTSDDVIDVIQESATEDMHKLVGINTKHIKDTPYTKITISQILKSRILWLFLIVIISIVGQIIFDSFLRLLSYKFQVLEAHKKEINIIIALASIIPPNIILIMNIANQTNMSIIRALALKEIDKKDYKKVIAKEYLAAIIISLILVILNFVKLSTYYAITQELIHNWKPYLAIIGGSSLALFLVVLLTNLLATAMPLLALKLKKDPSSISLPFINTITFVLSILLILGISIPLIFITL